MEGDWEGHKGANKASRVNRRRKKKTDGLGGAGSPAVLQGPGAASTALAPHSGSYSSRALLVAPHGHL